MWHRGLCSDCTALESSGLSVFGPWPLVLTLTAGFPGVSWKASTLVWSHTLTELASRFTRRCGRERCFDDTRTGVVGTEKCTQVKLGSLPYGGEIHGGMERMLCFLSSQSAPSGHWQGFCLRTRSLFPPPPQLSASLPKFITTSPSTAVPPSGIQRKTASQTTGS